MEALKTDPHARDWLAALGLDTCAAIVRFFALTEPPLTTTVIVIPRTSRKERLAENLAVFDFTLSDAEMTEIASLKRPDGRIVSPPHAPKWDQ